MIKVFIVDDQMMISEGLHVVLDAAATLQVVGTAHDGEEALVAIPTAKPDVVLMDLKMPRMNGIHATRVLKNNDPELLVIVLTTYDEDDWVVDAIRAGADGYLLKDISSQALIAAIEGAVAGRTPINNAVAEKLFHFIQSGLPPQSDRAEEFSERELEVLRLLAIGLNNQAIGERLHIAKGTVKNHVTQIFLKLGVTDRAKATALAWQYGLVKNKSLYD